MNTDPLITTTEIFVRQHLEGEGSGHDWWHVERVRATARALQGAEGGDQMVIDLALLLHDVGDRKVIKQDEDDYTIAENFLRKQQVDDTTIHTVMDIIKNMSYSRSFEDTAKPTSIEFQIVQDADRLDAIGAIGIGRTFAFGGSRDRALYDPEVSATAFASRSDYIKSKGSTLHHFDEKLFLLKDNLNTHAAKKIAKERDAFMHTFYDRFLDEWNGRA